MTNLKEMIAVMQAALGGAEIQCWPKRASLQRWHDISENGPVWNWGDNDYRVKKEPREWWAYVDPDGYDDQIIPYHPNDELGPHWIRVREVLDDD